MEAEPTSVPLICTSLGTKEVKPVSVTVILTVSPLAAVEFPLRSSTVAVTFAGFI